jgi:hypothetical protein
MAEQDFAANRGVWVTIRDLTVGDVIKPADHRYVVANVYQDRHRNFVADVIGEDGRHTSFMEISGAHAGFASRIGTGCPPTQEGLKKFIAGLDGRKIPE